MTAPRVYNLKKYSYIKKMERVEILKKHYEPRIDKYSETSEVLDWESREAQFKRFSAMTNNVNIKNKTILDVGCGCGDFYDMIKTTKDCPDYTGVDILQKMVDRATYEHSEAIFICADVFSKDFNPEKAFGRSHFDIVYASGIFNLQAGNNEEFLKKAIPILASLSIKVFAFNLLDPKSPNIDSSYFYYDPKDAIRLVKPFAKRIELIADYLDNDYTLICRKENE